MKTPLVASLLALTCTLLIGCGPTPQPDAFPAPSATPSGDGATVQGTVLNVIDGATIDVDIDGKIHRVRYLGIELPQGILVDDGGRSIGGKALEFNRFLVEGRTVELEKGEVESDLLGNLIRYVCVDGEMVNKTLLTNGYATVAAFPPEFVHQTEFLIAEEGAQTSLRGLWKQSSAGLHSPDASTGAPASDLLPASPWVPPFGSTLPAPPSLSPADRPCDYSGTPQAVIKGNVDIRTGALIYHVPGGLFYSTIEIEEEEGDRRFCTEEEAIEAGWKRSKR